MHISRQSRDQTRQAAARIDYSAPARALPDMQRRHPPDADARHDPHVLADLFCQLHYRIGTTMEEAMCGGVLSKAQGAALWLLASGIGEQGWMQQGELVRQLRDSQQINGSGVSRLLRQLAAPPLRLIQQTESPHSGR